MGLQSSHVVNPDATRPSSPMSPSGTHDAISHLCPCVSLPLTQKHRKRGNDDMGDCGRLRDLERENQTLREDIDILRRERDAEARRNPEMEDERARELLAYRETQAKLVGMLNRVLSRKSP